jgi:tetratricopeptide (TPR) repeat protein
VTAANFAGNGAISNGERRDTPSNSQLRYPGTPWFAPCPFPRAVLHHGVVNDLLAGLLAALVSTNTPTAVSNPAPARTNFSVQVPDPNDPVEKEFLNLEKEDDDAVAEIEKMSDAAGAAGVAGDPLAQTTLRVRVKERLDAVKTDYGRFLQHHPDYVRALLAYGSFLNQSGDAEGGLAQWEKAGQLAPDNPAVWNNLANYYEEHNVKKALEYYSKAIRLDPGQSVYYHNLAVCVYLFRADAEEYWQISEQETFDLSLKLYRKAMKLDPDNFILASDYAQCFYGITPLRLEEGLAAWKQCLTIAHDEVEREGVYLHLARFQLALNHFDESQCALDVVTNKTYSVLKDNLARNLQAARQRAATNAPPPPGR